MNKYESNVYKNLFEYPTKKIVELEFENEVLENENQLLKKQKADVVKVLKQLKGSARWERHLYEVDYMLEMLGEIDE